MFIALYPAVPQSFDFLLDVSEFTESVYAVVSHHDGDTKERAVGEEFGKYMSIVSTYIESNAPSEVQMVVMKNERIGTTFNLQGNRFMYSRCD